MSDEIIWGDNYDIELGCTCAEDGTYEICPLHADGGARHKP